MRLNIKTRYMRKRNNTRTLHEPRKPTNPRQSVLCIIMMGHQNMVMCAVNCTHITWPLVHNKIFKNH